MSVSFYMPKRLLVASLAVFACTALTGCLAFGHNPPKAPEPPSPSLSAIPAGIAIAGRSHLLQMELTRQVIEIRALSETCYQVFTDYGARCPG